MIGQKLETVQVIFFTVPKAKLALVFLRFTSVIKLGLDTTFFLFSLDRHKPFLYHGDYYLDVGDDHHTQYL